MSIRLATKQELKSLSKYLKQPKKELNYYPSLGETKKARGYYKTEYGLSYEGYEYSIGKTWVSLGCNCK